MLRESSWAPNVHDDLAKGGGQCVIGFQREKPSLYRFLIPQELRLPINRVYRHIVRHEATQAKKRKFYVRW